MNLLVWIMSRFSVSPELIGDIAEDHAEHRSVPRLSHQSFVAIATTAARGLWRSRRLTLCALETGWVLCFLWSQLKITLMPWWIDQPYQLTFSANLVVAFLLGWVVTRLQDRQPAGAVLVFVLPMVLMQVARDAYYLSSILEAGKRGDLFRFLEIQLWFAWLPLIMMLTPALFARSQRFSNP